MKKLCNFISEVYKLLTMTPTKAMSAFKINKIGILWFPVQICKEELVTKDLLSVSFGNAGTPA